MSHDGLPRTAESYDIFNVTSLANEILCLLTIEFYNLIRICFHTPSFYNSFLSVGSAGELTKTESINVQMPVTNNTSSDE